MDVKKILLLGLLVLSFGYLFFIEPYGQRLGFHAFVDQRPYLFIPNFMDVATNLFFFIFGLIGAFYCFKNRERNTWKIFFVAMMLIGFGSGYYHWSPNNQTLYWDRLPMTIAFMSFFSALIGEFVDKKWEKPFLLVFVLLGLFAVTYWRLVDDLRFYYWIQILPIVTVLFLLVFFKSRYTHSYYLLGVFACYILAKISESNDQLVFDYTRGIISGHSLKHFLASLAPLIVYFMLKKRTIKTS